MSRKYLIVHISSCLKIRDDSLNYCYNDCEFTLKISNASIGVNRGKLENLVLSIELIM